MNLWSFFRPQRSESHDSWVIFDFDGTLANSLPLQLEVYKVLAQRHSWPEVPLNQDLSLKEMFRERGIPLWQAPQLIREGREIIGNRWQEVSLYPGIEEALQQLVQLGFKLGVLTSNTKEVVETVLGKNCLTLFSWIEAEPKLWGKSRRIKHFCRQKQLAASRVFYVGDEIRDAQAARAARVRAVGVSWGLNSAKSLASMVETVAHTPKELVHWLEQQ